MMQSFTPLTDFLLSIGIEDVAHTNKSYLAHLVGVYNDLAAWGCGQDVCRAGMFHSIYGTERFQGFKLPLSRRGELRELLGERAERLAYVNCAMDRASFDRSVSTRGPYRIHDRIAGMDVELTEADFDDLCRVHLCDWLEQVPRSQEWDYRRAAYRQMGERLGGAALAAYERVFAAAHGAATPGEH